MRQAWEDDPSRFKDYVRSPKPSGCVCVVLSLSVCLVFFQYSSTTQ
jgi:hypothetical protein